MPQTENGKEVVPGSKYDKVFSQNMDPNIPIKLCPVCKTGYRVMIGEMKKEKAEELNVPSFQDSAYVTINLSLKAPGEKKDLMVNNCEKLYFKCNNCGNKEEK